jgi:hypothetical protein
VITGFFLETLFCGEIVTFADACAPTELNARNAIETTAIAFFIRTPLLKIFMIVEDYGCGRKLLFDSRHRVVHSKGFVR